MALLCQKRDTTDVRMWRDLFNFDMLYTAFAFRAYWLFCVKRELFYVERETQQIYVCSVI